MRSEERTRLARGQPGDAVLDKAAVAAEKEWGNLLCIQDGTMPLPSKLLRTAMTDNLDPTFFSNRCALCIFRSP
jgi:hypothetical protein